MGFRSTDMRRKGRQGSQKLAATSSHVEHRRDAVHSCSNFGDVVPWQRKFSLPTFQPGEIPSFEGRDESPLHEFIECRFIRHFYQHNGWNEATKNVCVYSKNKLDTIVLEVTIHFAIRQALLGALSEKVHYQAE